MPFGRDLFNAASSLSSTNEQFGVKKESIVSHIFKNAFAKGARPSLATALHVADAKIKIPRGYRRIRPGHQPAKDGARYARTGHAAGSDSEIGARSHGGDERLGRRKTG